MAAGLPSEHSTACPANEAFLLRFAQKAKEERIPLSGGIDLTRRCNLRCAHCYHITGQTCAPPVQEMSCDQITAIVEQIVDAGCLFLLVTGGEPLLRQDFRDVYLYMKEKGLLLTLFTNGTLIDESMADFLAELPPKTVEITLYGATERTYEKVTGIKGSYARCLRGIERLQTRGVYTRLKTMAMTWNADELQAMESFAEERGMKFRMDVCIFGATSGDVAPLDLRLDPDRAAELEFSNPKRADEWVEYGERAASLTSTNRTYVCGAGVNRFHIDARGLLLPCILSRAETFDLTHGSFLEGWQEVIPRIWERKMSADSDCVSCNNRGICGICPAISALETGQDDAPIPFFCGLGRARQQQLRRRSGDCGE